MLEKLIARTVACALAGVVLPPTAQAGTCGSVASVTKALHAEYDKLAPQLPHGEKVDRMIKFWNAMVASSWAKLGLRRLDFGKNLNGTLTGPTSRIFIAETPSDMKHADLMIRKLDGEARTSITVCEVDSEGNQQKVWDFTVDNGKGTETFKRTVEGLEGRILTVHIKGHSATDSFKYSVRADKKNP